MFGVTLNNESGVSAELKPNGDIAGGVSRYIEVSGYPVPISIIDIGDQNNVPETWAVEMFDGQRTYQIGYEGNGNITVTLNADGVFAASSGFGPSIEGNLVPPITR
ncbi:hypothetical protein HQ531_14315 [bacterium]|nr:hypothetical protein [bacterium]